MKKISSFLGGLQIAMQALAERRGINLRIGGNTACTDGKTIIIPDLPDNDQEASILARGYIDHEAAHVSLTDFSIPVGGKIFLNILEDVRIERIQGEKYPGVAINTRELLNLLLAKGESFNAPESDLLGNLQVWTAARARNRILRQTAIATKEVAGEKYCRAVFGDSFCDQFAEIVDEVKTAKSTADCKDLVDRLEALLNAPPPPPQPDEDEDCDSSQSSKSKSDSSGSDKDKKGSDSGKNEDEDGDEDGNPSQSGKSKSDSSESDKDKEGPESGKNKDEDGDEYGDSSQSGKSKSSGGSGDERDSSSESGRSKSSKDRKCDSSGSGASSALRQKQVENIQSLKNAETDINLDMGEMLQQALQEKNGGVDSGRTGSVGTAIRKSPVDHTSEKIFKDFQKDLSETRRKTAKMRGQLAGLLQAMKLKQAYPTCAGHRLNGRSTHLVAACTPDTRVFASKQERKMDNTAITLLIDASGSMSSDINLAVQAAFTSADTLESMQGITCCVGVFPWEYSEGEATQILLVNKFGELPKPEQFFDIGSSGGTPIADALLWAGLQLYPRPEERKIIIIFTDGDPDDYSEALQAVKDVRRHRMEVYVLALDKSGYRSSLASAGNWIDRENISLIARIDQLPTALNDLFKRTLLKKRAA